MDNFQVAQCDLAHEWGPAFVAQKKDACAITPQRAILDSDALDIAGRVQSLESHTIIIGSNEAIGNEHVLRVAGIDAIIILHSGAAQLHVANNYLPAIAWHDGPVPGSTNRNAADFDVGAADRHHKRCWALGPFPVGSIQDPAALDANIPAWASTPPLTTAPPAR